MDNVCEDDDNEEDDSANSKVNDVEANKNQGTKSENDEPDPPPNKKKRGTNQIEKNCKDHDAFKKPQQKKNKSNSQVRHDKF